MKDDPKKDRPILPFTLKNGFELATTAPPNIPSLVDGLLIQVGTSLLSADPKCGKSCIARQLLVAVAEGRDFLGFPTLCGDALYLYLEGPIGVVQQHFQKLGLTDQRGKVHVIEERIEDKVFGLQRLSETVKSLPNLRLIVVDPLFKLLRLSDSFKPEEVTSAMELLEKFAKQHNLHVMVLMHEKKKKNEERHQNSLGSVMFRASSDTNISITKQGNQRIISSEQRWGVCLEPTLLIGFDELTQTSELGKTLESQEQEKRQTKGKKTVERIENEILAALDKKSLTQGQLLAEVSGKNVKILEVLAELVATAKVQEQVDGKAKRYSRAALPVEATPVITNKIVGFPEAA